jgi:hypothetical protein
MRVRRGRVNSEDAHPYMRTMQAKVKMELGV